jgi:hypothetical protein
MMSGRETSAAFLFDPATGSVTPTGSLRVARFGHAAVRLDDGRVLVAGGMGQRDDGTFGELRSAELFDPRTGSFESTGPMTLARGWGRQRGGGESRPDAVQTGDGRVIVGDPTTWTDLYDPATGTFERFRGEPELPAAMAMFASQDCQCAHVLDLHTAAVDRVGTGVGSAFDLPRNVLVGGWLVVVDGDAVAVDDLATAPTGLSLNGDWVLPILPGSAAVPREVWLPSTTALDPIHVLIAGGRGSTGSVTDAQILTLPVGSDRPVDQTTKEGS